MSQNNNRKMKDSGIPWMPSIPDTWEVQRGKNILVLNKRPVRESDEVVTCFRDGEVILRSERRTDGFTMSDKEIGYQGINKGDIVIHGMDGFAGSMGVSKSTGKGSPVLVVCSPKYDAVPEFIIYYLRTLAMTDVFVALSTGIRERSCDLRWNKIAELQFALPSSNIQQRIADFLDRKCAEIDELAALQETMIAELKRYKQSVITEAVTKGLDPNVPMKDSGVEWIGEIPKGWEVIPFKQMYGLGKGLSITKADLVEEGVPVISYGQIHSKSNTGTAIKDELIRYVPTSYLENNQDALVKVGDIIFADTSEDLEGCGNCIYIDKDMTLFAGYHTIIASNRTDTATRYLSYLFKTDCWRIQIRAVVNGVKLFSIPQRTLAATSIITPPLAEQRAIADYLDRKCTEIDELIAIKQQKIEALKEYKKSVIFEYVTGKKEVL